MEIIVAENSGFCFGVENAINSSMKAISECNGKIYSLGPLIHNNQVINLLKQKGLDIIEDIDEVKGEKVIIRSHGVPLDVYEKAKQNNIEIIDTTCPFVRKIQEKAKEYYERGYTIIIIGNPNHPEVKGINGWCNNSAYIVDNEDDVNMIPECEKMCILAQTTITHEKFSKLSDLVSKKGKELKIFNTICNATKLRQEACEKVAKMVDAMVVIGGYHSSNTQKLVQISKKYCKKTYHIETPDELPIEELTNYDKIGVTAGASTPIWLIKEVINKMEKSQNQMSEMMETIENSMIKLHRGDIVKGTVISVNENEVMVNIGYKSDGIIKREELSNDIFLNPESVVKTGEEIDVYVIKLDDGEGNVLLSKKRADSIKGLEKLQDKFENGETVKAKIIEIVNGGVICIAEGIRGFIPASHLSANYVKDFSKYLGKEMNVKIIEFDKNKNKIVMSRKLVEKEELEDKKEEVFNSLIEGQKISGIVKRITDFGVFVDIGGVDGLIHISDLSWGRVAHPSEVVKEGDTVEVIVLNIDKEKERISLGLKQNISHPWEKVNEKYKEGDTIKGKVTKLVNFGAFVELEPGIEGLVHISQISEDHIAKPSDKLKEGEIVQVKILNINKDDKKISLSIKEANSKQAEEYNIYKGQEQDEITIGDIIKNK